MKWIFLFTLVLQLIACAITSTGSGFAAYDDNRIADSVPFFEAGVAEGDKHAAVMLALIYLADTQIPKDIAKAQFYYDQIFAVEGSRYDQYLDFYLPFIQASIYLNDEITENDEQGLALLRHARYQSFPAALSLLAKSYGTGQGVKANYWLSHTLFLRAIEFSDNPHSNIQYAWLLAVHPDDEYRESVNPMEFMPDRAELQGDYQFIYYETLAAVEARDGQFTLAIKHQLEAIELIQLQLTHHPNYQSWLDQYREDLSRYQQHQPLSIAL